MRHHAAPAGLHGGKLTLPLHARRRTFNHAARFASSTKQKHINRVLHPIHHAVHLYMHQAGGLGAYYGRQLAHCRNHGADDDALCQRPQARNRHADLAAQAHPAALLPCLLDSCVLRTPSLPHEKCTSAACQTVHVCNTQPDTSRRVCVRNGTEIPQQCLRSCAA